LAVSCQKNWNDQVYADAIPEDIAKVLYAEAKKGSKFTQEGLDTEAGSSSASDDSGKGESMPKEPSNFDVAAPANKFSTSEVSEHKEEPIAEEVVTAASTPVVKPQQKQACPSCSGLVSAAVGTIWSGSAWRNGFRKKCTSCKGTGTLETTKSDEPKGGNKLRRRLGTKRPSDSRVMWALLQDCYAAGYCDDE